ncbi:hypothetical protein LPJ53_006323, partial [Coemansia erecta]
RRNSEFAGANGDGGVHAQISKKLSANLPIKSMVDGYKKGSRRQEHHASNNTYKYKSAQDEIDAPLFIGIKDEMSLFEDKHGDNK